MHVDNAPQLRKNPRQIRPQRASQSRIAEELWRAPNPPSLPCRSTTSTCCGPTTFRMSPPSSCSDPPISGSFSSNLRIWCLGLCVQLLVWSCFRLSAPEFFSVFLAPSFCKPDTPSGRFPIADSLRWRGRGGRAALNLDPPFCSSPALLLGGFCLLYPAFPVPTLTHRYLHPHRCHPMKLPRTPGCCPDWLTCDV